MRESAPTPWPLRAFGFPREIKPRTAIGLLSCLVAAAVLPACMRVERSASPSSAADVILWQGRVYTVDDARPWAEAVAVKDGRIQFVGSNEEVQAHLGPATRLIDLDDRLAMPGFIDSHAHPVITAGVSDALLLDRGDTPQQWLAALESYAEDDTDRPAILGFGFLAAAFGPTGPTKEMLDAIVPDRPVVLVDDGGHSAWVNSKALQQAGIDKDTPDPVPGVHYFQRNPDGEATGWCLEAMTFNPLLLKLGFISADSIVRGSDQLFWLLSSFGITTVFDAGMSVFEDVAFEALRQLEAEGRLPFRVVASHQIQSPDQVEGAIDRLRFLQEEYESGLIQPRVLKIHNDGTKEAFTAALFESYSNQVGRGSLLLEGEPLRQFVSDVAQAGFDIHIHAIGDRAVAEALDAFEAARENNPSSKVRYSMAHVELIRDVDIPRFAELDVVLQTTPFWFASDLEYETELLGRDRAEKLFRVGDVKRTGGLLSFGSDFPATGDRVGIFPIFNIEMGMTRRRVGEPDMPVTPPADSVLTLETMLRGYTINAAYQLNLEKELGSLEVGKRADLVVLTENPFESAPENVHDARVALTMMGGDIVYERGWKTHVAEWALGM